MPPRNVGRLLGCATVLGLTLPAAGCPSTRNCGGYCGPGTECADDLCVVAQAEPEADEEPQSDDKGSKRRKGRRRGRKGRGGGGGDDEFAGPVHEPLNVNDSHVPRYNPNRTQNIGMADGTERLSDFAVKNHMKRLESKFNKCIEQASLATEDTISGTVDFTIGVEPTGKVWGVTVKAPASMKKHGVVACIRVAVHKSRFPKWNGPSMGVDYSFEVG